MFGKILFTLCTGLLTLSAVSSCQKSNDEQAQAEQQMPKTPKEQLLNAIVEIRGILTQIKDKNSAEMYVDELIKARDHMFQLGNALSKEDKETLKNDSEINRMGTAMQQEIQKITQAECYHCEKLKNAFIAK